MAATAAAALAIPAAANAAVTGTVTGDTATLTGDAANDNIIISVSGDKLRHNLAGFNSNIDFDSATPGDQTLTAAAGAADDRRWRRRRHHRRRPQPRHAARR